MSDYIRSFTDDKKKALKIAKELLYPEEIMIRIREATNMVQVENALADGRKNIKN